MKNDNIKCCYHFPLFILCVIIYVIIFRVLSFMLSFGAIIFHSQQMLTFLCYHFPLYIFNKKYFFGRFFFLSYCIQHCFICRPSDSTVPTDAGIEPRTVATGALAVRRSNHQARSHPHIQCYHLCYHLMLSFDVIIYCYHFPLFSFSLKRDTLIFKGI